MLAAQKRLGTPSQRRTAPAQPSTPLNRCFAGVRRHARLSLANATLPPVTSDKTSMAQPSCEARVA